MSYILFNCPECRNPLKLPLGLARPSEFIMCPCCDKRVKVPQSASRELQEMPTIIRSKPKKADKGTSASQNIFFDCPECSRPLKLPPGIAGPGGRIICPKCSKEVRVPKDDQKPPPSPTVVRMKPKEKVKTRKTPKPRKRVRQRKISPRTRLIIACAGLVVVIATLILCRILVVKRCTGKISRLADFFGPYGEVTYGATEISPLGHNIRIRDVVIKPRAALRPISISYLILDRFSTRKGIPPRLDIEAHGVHIPLYPETFGKAGPGMRGLDYYCISSRVTCSYKYNSSKSELAINKLVISAPTIGDIVLSLDISNINLSAEDMELGDLIARLSEWEINEGRFEYHDDSFLRRFIAYQADYIGETVDELNAGMLTDLEAVIRKEPNSFTRSSLSGFRKFLQNRRHLVITSSPSSPVPFYHLGNIYNEKGIKGLIPELKLRFP